jgi:hypothetical protein
MNKLIAFVLAASLLTSCASMNFESSSRDLITLSSVDKSSFEVVGHFREEVRVFYTLAGLIAFQLVDIDKILRRYVVQYGGDGVANLTIRTETGVVDYLVSLGIGVGTGLILSGAAGYYASSSTFSVGVSLGSLLLNSRTAILEGNVIARR